MPAAVPGITYAFNSQEYRTVTAYSVSFYQESKGLPDPQLFLTFHCLELVT